MKGTGIIFIGATGVLLYIAYKSISPAIVKTIMDTAAADEQNLETFADKGAQNVKYLETVAHALVAATDPNTGLKLSLTQLRILLAQILQESGLFTSKPNLKLIGTFHNYTGIKGNSKWKAAAGSVYVKYPTVEDYVKDYLRILSLDFGSGKPLESVDPQQFVTRLNVNGYFAKSSLPDYKKNIPVLYDLMGQFAV
jgi:hypothetical protein